MSRQNCQGGWREATPVLPRSLPMKKDRKHNAFGRKIDFAQTLSFYRMRSAVCFTAKEPAHCL